MKKKKSFKVGLPPGSLEYIGVSDHIETAIKVRSYNEKSFSEQDVTEPDTTKSLLKPNCVNWVEINGLNNPILIENIGKQFNIHTMLLEDILNTEHLPKYEVDESYAAFFLKVFSLGKNDEHKINHICLLLHNNTIIQFQDFEPEILKNKIERIKQSKGRARKLKADYLFYLIVDAFVDSYYLFFTRISEKVSELEDKLLSAKSSNLMEEIYSLKTELNNIRKHLFPLREAFNDLVSDEPGFIEETNKVFFSDLKDHLNQLIEFYLLYNENVKSLVDLNNSNLNNNINAVMKTLTIIATIFIPLTFIAGIYGMNFEFMPELGWRWAYFAVLGIMLVITIGMLFYFRKKKWL